MKITRTIVRKLEITEEKWQQEPPNPRRWFWELWKFRVNCFLVDFLLEPSTGGEISSLASYHRSLIPPR